MTLLKGKRRSPNIVRGGRAIPFGNPNDNLYYLQLVLKLKEVK